MSALTISTKLFDWTAFIGVGSMLLKTLFVDWPITDPTLTDQEKHDLWYPKLTDVTEERIKTKFGRINVMHGGKKDGTALVLWPSLMMKASMWSYQYEYFRHKYYVVLIDSPGINKSDALRKPINLEDCKDILVDILDALKIEKCVFGGNSWGAMMAGVLPTWIPERLHGTIIVNGTASLPTTLETVLMTICGELLMMNEFCPNWWVRLAQDAFAGPHARNDLRFMTYIQAVSQEDPKSIAWAIKSILLGRTDTHELCKENTGVPVLVLAGAEDHQFTTEIVKSYADAIPGSKFVIVPETGHLSSRENPKVVNREFETWLNEIGV